MSVALAAKMRELCGRVWQGDREAIALAKRITATALLHVTGRRRAANPREMLLAASLLTAAIQGGHGPRHAYISNVSGLDDPITVGAARYVRRTGKRLWLRGILDPVALLRRLRAYRLAYGSRPRR